VGENMIGDTNKVEVKRENTAPGFYPVLIETADAAQTIKLILK
jgi:hypothetical protein